MSSEELFLRQTVVLGSGAIYWAGVVVQIRRVRQHIGRSPNVRPRGPEEKLLWLGWFLVVAGWLGQPCLIHSQLPGVTLPLRSALVHPAGLILGVLFIVAGYAGTLWCYAALGKHWRMGVNRSERTPLVTGGPYRVTRHPIYLFQIVMLVGVALLLPTLLSALVLILHFLCVQAKAAAEERHLLAIHGEEYRQYAARTGKLVPRRRRHCR